MYKTVNRSEVIKARLQKQGKRVLLDQPKDLAAFKAVNTSMEKVTKEFRVKDHNSQKRAASIRLQ
jgi:hypothetical protein